MLTDTLEATTSNRLTSSLSVTPAPIVRVADCAASYWIVRELAADPGCGAIRRLIGSARSADPPRERFRLVNEHVVFGALAHNEFSTSDMAADE